MFQNSVSGTFLVITTLRGTTCPTLQHNQSRLSHCGLADSNIATENSLKTKQQEPTELPIDLNVIVSDANTVEGNASYPSADQHMHNKTMNEVGETTLVENVTLREHNNLQNEDMEKKEIELGRATGSDNVTAERMDAVEKSSTEGPDNDTIALYDVQKDKGVNDSANGVNTSHIDSMNSMNHNASTERNNEVQKESGVTTNNYEAGNGITTIKRDVQHQTEDARSNDEVGSGYGTVKHATTVGSNNNGVSKTGVALLKVHNNDDTSKENNNNTSGPDTCITCDIHILRFSLAVVVIDWLFVLFGAFYFCHFVYYKCASLKDHLLLINA